MNVSRSDLFSLGVQAVVAALIGLSMGTVKLYCDRRIGGSISADTNALHSDRRLWVILCEIHRRINNSVPEVDAAWLLLIHHADDLVFTHVCLVDKSLVPTRAIGQQTVARITKCREQLRVLIDHYVGGELEKQDFRTLCNRFASVLNEHAVAIDRLVLRCA